MTISMCLHDITTFTLKEGENFLILMDLNWSVSINNEYLSLVILQIEHFNDQVVYKD